MMHIPKFEKRIEVKYLSILISFTYYSTIPSNIPYKM